MEKVQYTKEWLEKTCAESFSYAEVLRKSGRKQGGGAQATLKEKIALYNIDVSHFTLQSWSKGKTKETDSRTLSKEKYSLQEVFCDNSPVTQRVLRGYVERHKLIEYKCDTCGCTGEWQDGFISLELDHKDGNNKNNKISNLHYLCPNCHALTETYRGKNKETYKNAPVDEKSFVEALQTTPNIRQALIKLNLSPAGANYSRAKELLNKYQIVQKDI